MKETSNQYERLLKSFNDRKSEMSLDDIKAFTEAALQSASLNEEGHKISGQAITDQIDILVNERNSRFSNDHKAQELENLTGMTIGDIVAKVAAGSFGNVEYNHKVKVPQFVASYIDYAKQCLDINILTSTDYSNVHSNLGKIKGDEFTDWIEEGGNSDTYCRAWLEGYEVEEEPKYYWRKKEKHNTHLDKRIYLVTGVDLQGSLGKGTQEKFTESEAKRLLQNDFDKFEKQTVY